MAAARKTVEDDEEEEEVERYRVLKVNPFQLGDVSLSYEKMRTERISNEFGLSYVYQGYLKSDDFLPDAVSVIGLHVRMSRHPALNAYVRQIADSIHAWLVQVTHTETDTDVEREGMPCRRAPCTERATSGSRAARNASLKSRLNWNMFPRSSAPGKPRLR